jgi:hypothetical protein
MPYVSHDLTLVVVDVGVDVDVSQQCSPTIQLLRALEELSKTISNPVVML